MKGASLASRPQQHLPEPWSSLTVAARLIVQPKGFQQNECFAEAAWKQGKAQLNKEAQTYRSSSHNFSRLGEFEVFEQQLLKLG